MPKSISIHPDEQRKAGLLELKPIPINQYQKTHFGRERNYTSEELVRIYRDMLLIRRFETMLQIVKTQREFAGVAYDHKGPAHLSIGQEASAVGTGVFTRM